MRPRVYITQPVAQSAVERLRQVAEVKLNSDPLHIVSKDELLAAVRDHDILFCLLHDRVDRDVIAANPRLRGVASMTITPADIDVAEATARRIPVTVIPALLLHDATADLTWALLLAVARRVAEGDRLMRVGTFPGSQSSYLEGGGVSRKVLGLVGMGGVGRAVARRARGFAMQLLYHDPRRLPAEEERELGLTWRPFEQLLAESDFVSLHVQLTPQTRHLIGARELGFMKPTAYLVNTARGPVVDEPALIRALRERRIAGAGLDVFESEPRIDPALLALPHVVFTPHVGSAVTELRKAMANVVADNVLAVLDGRQPPNCWNPQIYATPG
ncbi:MAG: D-glycerate dehydrogenase [Betaproteobacteria bacterium]|nr:D-glycerate dehydrogenase [Betaproteobacteria bacterium]